MYKNENFVDLDFQGGSEGRRNPQILEKEQFLTTKMPALAAWLNKI
tara:strand:- start:97 stop:234 length:138 start_codon:yes stop_codon:yes gene_type:complete